MMKIEALAKKNFEDFCSKAKTKGNWEYLNLERKLQWMQEVLDIAKIIVNDIEFKPMPPVKIGQSSLEMGFNEGIRRERIIIEKKLKDYFLDLQQQLEDYKNQKE